MIDAILREAFAAGTMNGSNGEIIGQVATSAPQCLATMLARRCGDPAESGRLCAYDYSAQASCITGQNFLIDGGS